MNGHLPQTVREILEDKSILKFGVGIKEDAKRLTGMFGVRVMGCVDLRHVVERCQVDETVQARYMLKIICYNLRHQEDYGGGRVALLGVGAPTLPSRIAYFVRLP